MSKELHLGKMTGQEIAEWLGITYNTYKKNIKKHLDKLDGFCDFEQIYGGINVKEIYVSVYDKNLSKEIDTCYLREVKENKGLATVSGVAEKYGFSTYQVTKSRNRLFGELPLNFEEPHLKKGMFGYRNMIWAVKVIGGYARLTLEEEELFNTLIRRDYSTLDVEKVKQEELILDYCVNHGLKAEVYKDLRRTAGLDFFAGVCQSFYRLTGGRRLVRVNEHEITVETEEERRYYDLIDDKEIETTGPIMIEGRNGVKIQYTPLWEVEGPKSEEYAHPKEGSYDF